MPKQTENPVIKILSHTEIPADFFSSPRFLHREITEKVSLILESVRTRGDAAIREYAAQFDAANPAQFAIPQEALKAAEAKLKSENPALYDALCFSHDTATRFAQKQRGCFTDFETELHPGLFTAQKIIPVQTAGIYVPAGRYPLISSVIMGVVPAKAAGVTRTILCTPPKPHPSKNAALPWADEGILAAAALCGVDQVFAVGGAQAIGAMAYATETIPRADVIAGPGNAYVAEAKRLIFGDAGIDMLAGPTEVLIIADDSANPAWVAADMLAQAEHDTRAQSVLVTWSEAFAKTVYGALENQLKTLPTAETARQSLHTTGLIITVETPQQAADIANKKAPEHLELALHAGETRNFLEMSLKNYGSLFIGHLSAEVFGDYAAGLNHTLPTGGSARFTGGLSVRHFLKTVTVLKTAEQTGEKSAGSQSRLGIQNAANAAALLGNAEGLAAHAAAARIRIKNDLTRPS